MFKYTRTTLKKIEGLFSAIEYTVRYEKGNFQSGYCIVENRKIAVINKFFDIEARINCLLEILSTLDLENAELEEEHIQFYKKLSKSFLSDGEDSEVNDGVEENGNEVKEETPAPVLEENLPQA